MNGNLYDVTNVTIIQLGNDIRLVKEKINDRLSKVCHCVSYLEKSVLVEEINELENELFNLEQNRKVKMRDLNDYLSKSLS